MNGQGQLRGTLNISERPAEADDRAVPGHWEGDLLMGKRMHAMATLVERKTRFVMLIALPDGHAANVVADALAAKIVELPQQLRRSLTWDQGKEMAHHARFSIKTGVPVYFCDPRSPWQRGSNENTNGLLRQYFPKRSEIAHFTQADLDNVAAELNGGLDKPSAGRHHHKHSTKRCDDHLNPQPFCVAGALFAEHLCTGPLKTVGAQALHFAQIGWSHTDPLFSLRAWLHAARSPLMRPAHSGNTRSVDRAQHAHRSNRSRRATTRI